LVNDELREIRDRHPDRFACLGSIPLTDLGYAIQELKRVSEHLRMDGIILGTHVCGEGLDSKRFYPFFEEANKLNIPVFIHPMDPRGDEELYKEFQTSSTVGFTFETTLVITKMVLGGFFETFPNIKMVLPHLGGTIPFLRARIDLAFKTYEHCRAAIGRTGKLPSDYLKLLYYDTTTSDWASLFCTYQLAGSGQILFGTDNPYTRGFRIPLSIDLIEESKLNESEKENIFFRNISRLVPRLT